MRLLCNVMNDLSVRREISITREPTVSPGYYYYVQLFRVDRLRMYIYMVNVCDVGRMECSSRRAYYACVHAIILLIQLLLLSPPCIYASGKSPANGGASSLSGDRRRIVHNNYRMQITCSNTLSVIHVMVLVGRATRSVCRMTLCEQRLACVLRFYNMYNNICV